MMQHRTLDEIGQVAQVQSDLQLRPKMSRRERLERWAEMLDRQQGRRLRSLYETEYVINRLEHDAMRADNSPLTVAFEDPVLRSAGLQGDTLGDAMKFFELSRWEAHRIVCYCYHGLTISGREAARAVRSAARHERHVFPSRDGTATRASRSWWRFW
jgi:hypothetical protein